MVLFVLGDYKMLLSSQLAALGMLTVTLGSFRGYKALIQKQLDEFSEEDYAPYDEIADLDEDEKPKKDWKLIFQTFKGLISFFRLLGYGVLVFSFVYLHTKGSLSIVGFLIGISMVPFAALVSIKRLA